MHYIDKTIENAPCLGQNGGRTLRPYQSPLIKRLHAYSKHDVLYVTSHISGPSQNEPEYDFGFIAPKSSDAEKVRSFGPVIEERNKIWE